jgi:hypothetical protein
MPRPPIKATERLEYAKVLGKLRAEHHFYLITHKMTPKSLERRLSDHIGKMLDTMTFKDTIDIIAAIGITPFVYDALQSVQPVVSAVEGLLTGKTENAIVNNFLSIFNPWAWVQSIESHLNPQPAKGPIASLNAGAVLNYMLAFGISWCIVKWGDKMISAGLGSLTGILGMLGL